MRLIVCGSRSGVDRQRVSAELSRLHAKKPITVLVHGNCPTGADEAADSWALRKRVHVTRFSADWNKEGRAAGPLRNARMASAGGDLCVAFWDGKSPGTLDMIRCAVQCGIPARIVPAVLADELAKSKEGAGDER